MKKVFLFLALVAAVSFTACTGSKKAEAPETVTEQVEEAVDSAEEAIEEAVDSVEEAVEEVTE